MEYLSRGVVVGTWNGHLEDMGTQRIWRLEVQKMDDAKRSTNQTCFLAGEQTLNVFLRDSYSYTFMAFF